RSAGAARGDPHVLGAQQAGNHRPVHDAVKAFAPELAARALARWHGGEAGSLERIASRGNRVWRFLSDGQPFILRLTHDEWRTYAENEAECAFLEHVHA